MKAEGRSILRIGFDPAEWSKLTVDQREEFCRWHVMRLLSGESSAEVEWTRMGLRVRLDPWNGE